MTKDNDLRMLTLTWSSLLHDPNVPTEFQSRVPDNRSIISVKKNRTSKAWPKVYSSHSPIYVKAVLYQV